MARPEPRENHAPRSTGRAKAARIGPRTGFGGSPEPRSAARHTLRLTEERRRNMVSGRSRAHPGNVG
jgi:hypothetical protein